MIPMGTVMTVCMLIGAIGMAAVLKFPRPLRVALGLLLEAAGAWNAFWYGVQHFSEFWGQMAFWSGLTMMLAGALCLRVGVEGVREIPRQLIPLLVLLLASFGGYYAWTIYNL